MNQLGSRTKDLTGLVHNKLTVIGFSHKDSSRRTFWICRCECGNKKTVRSDYLCRDDIYSCGCYHKEKISSMMKKQTYTKTHGMTKTPEWTAWKSMIERCYKSYNKRYKDYGGRGIIVCEKWINSFECFYNDMYDTL